MPTRPVPRPRRVAALAILATLLAAALPAASSAAPAPRWVLSNERSVPLEWFQGLTHQPAAGGLGPRFFVGVFVGVTRTDAALAQQARNGDVLPPAVAAAGFNHIGDPSWLPALGGRLLLPLECYTPGGPNGGNTCGRGAFGLLDPATLQWRGLVRLDPADIPKAMWAEVSPDGRLVWTSAGDDLLAYRVADVLAAVDATTAIRPVRRLVGAVPPSGVTGADLPRAAAAAQRPGRRERAPAGLVDRRRRHRLGQARGPAAGRRRVRGPGPRPVRRRPPALAAVALRLRAPDVRERPQRDRLVRAAGGGEAPRPGLPHRRGRGRRTRDAAPAGARPSGAGRGRERRRGHRHDAGGRRRAPAPVARRCSPGGSW